MDTPYKVISVLIAAALLAIPAVVLLGDQPLSGTRKGPPTAKIQNPMGPADSIETKNWCADPYEARTLLVVGADNRADGTSFCTSTDADAKVFTDKKGRHFVFLEYSEGSGTSAKIRLVEIFQFRDGELFPIMETRLGWWAAPHAYFKYDYTVGYSEPGGLLLTLKGTLDAQDLNDVDCCVPHEKTRIIRIDHAD